MKAGAEVVSNQGVLGGQPGAGRIAQRGQQQPAKVDSVRDIRNGDRSREQIISDHDPFA